MKPLVIKDFQQGAAISPHLGFAYFSGADLVSVPGVMKCSPNPSIVSATTVLDLVKWIKQDPATPTSYYALDRSGNFYQSTNSGSTWSLITGNTLTGATGEGLEIWKNYAFIARSGKLDVLNLAASPLSTGWTNGWQNLTATNAFAPMVAGMDDILYIGNGYTVASVQYTGTTFVPGSATFNSAALTLPTSYSIKCMAELGDKLMIGTTAVGGSTGSKLADIFPWDRTKATFELRMRFFDFGIHQMATVDNLLYFTIGQEHTLMVTNGTTTQEVRKFGYNIASLNPTSSTITFNPYPGAIIKQRGRVMTGVSGIVGTNTTGVGIWSIKGSDAVNDYPLSGSTEEVGALISMGPYTYMAGMINSTTKAIYKADTTVPQSAVMYSALYPVGTALNPVTITRIDVIFDQPMTSSTSLVLYYRYSTTDSWTQIGSSITSTMYGLVDNVPVAAGSINARNLQIRADLSDSNSTIGLKSLTLS